jgi:hypothetical protein
MKKYTSFFLMFVFALSLMTFTQSPTYANTNTTIYSDYSETVSAGENLKLPVCINNNTGLMGLRLNIGYDSDVLTPASVEYGDVFNSGLQDNIEGDADEGFVKVYWSGTANNIENGILFYINFTVDSTASGKTTITLSYSQDDTFDENYEDVVLDCQDVEINVANNLYSRYAKITASAEDVTVGENFSVSLNLSELKSLETMQLSLKYPNDIFEFISAASDANVTSENDNGNLVLKIDSINAEMNNSEFVKVMFRCKEQASVGEYVFDMNSVTEGVFCKDCTVRVKSSLSNEAAVIYADEIAANNNDVIEVPVKISNNHGIMGYLLHFEYNASELEILSAESSSAFVGNFENNIGDKIDNFDVLWTGSSAIAEDGTILKLNIKAITDKEITSRIKISYSQEDTFNENYEDVVLNCEDIAVKLNASEHTDDDVVPIKTIKLKRKKFVYNGKVKTPSVVVTDTNGKAISSKYYTAKYAKGRKKVGKYAVKVTFKGKYSGYKKLYFTIIPKSTKITKATAIKKGVKLKWKKQKSQATGYQVQYSTKKNFNKKKSITIKKNKTVSKTIKKLKPKKKYYIRIRTYKTVKGKRYYSKWSKVKTVKVK